MSDLDNATLDEAQIFVREQFSSVWRQQLERLHQMAAAWPLEVERTLEGTKADLMARLEQQYRLLIQERIEAAVRQARAHASTQLVGGLNQAVRRICSSRGDADWRSALLDATQGFCDRAALFTLHHGTLRLEATRNIARAVEFNAVPLADAPAFREAVETRDTLVAMRGARQMSASIAASFGEAENARFHLFPITSQGALAALLYADGEDLQVELLELLASVAGAVFENRSAAGRPKAGLVNIASARREPDGSVWSTLSNKDQELHHKARRFARVQIASIRLYQSDGVKSGRAQRNLYTVLKEQIDAGRGVFRRDYISKSETMVDYFHLELVGTLANDEVELLGSDYPGPMV